MKFSTSLLLVLPLFVSHVAAASIPGPLSARQTDQRKGGFGRGGGRGNANNGGNANNAGNNAAGNNNNAAGGAANNGTANAGGAVKGGAAAGGAANNGTANAGGAAAGGAAAGGAAAGGAAAAGGDPQKSLTLDPKVIAAGFANNGQNPPVAGQVASLTSTNNFINFCLTVPNLPITDGKQITTGSCNPAPIGTIPSVDNMPSAKFVNPKNGATIPADKAFTIQMAISKLATGNFVNAQANYFAAPQQLNAQGQIIGHSHVVMETLTAIDQTTPTDPKKFAFFKGLNAAAAGGQLTADVTAGVPAGAYRLCSINTSANHQPAIVPIAQHGSLDDCVYFTATAGGAAAGGAAAGGAAAGGAAAGGAAAGGAATNGTAAAGGAAAGAGKNNAGNAAAGNTAAGTGKNNAGTAAAAGNANAGKNNAGTAAAAGNANAGKNNAGTAAAAGNANAGKNNAGTAAAAGNANAGKNAAAGNANANANNGGRGGARNNRRFFRY